MPLPYSTRAFRHNFRRTPTPGRDLKPPARVGRVVNCARTGYSGRDGATLKSSIMKNTALAKHVLSKFENTAQVPNSGSQFGALAHQSTTTFPCGTNPHAKGVHPDRLPSAIPPCHARAPQPPTFFSEGCYLPANPGASCKTRSNSTKLNCQLLKPNSSKYPNKDLKLNSRKPTPSSVLSQPQSETTKAT